MVEGEFKKRILLAQISFGERLTDMNIVERVLDEARKEFPLTEKQLRVFNGIIRPDDLGDLGNIDIVEFARWFKKWFGDGNEAS